MYRQIALVAMLLSASVVAITKSAAAQSKASEILLKAEFETVVPLTSFSGEVTPIDIDPRFALTLRVEKAEPVVKELARGAEITFAIHSPSLLFGGDPFKGGTYDFRLRRETTGKKVRFLDLRLAVWHYPDDRRAISSQEPPKPYHARGLPDGTVSILTKYREPGFQVPAPQGGLWRLHYAVKLYYQGKMFAIVTGFTGSGYVTSFVIYDEDGDGKFEHLVELNDENGPIDFHLPNWVTR